MRQLVSLLLLATAGLSALPARSAENPYMPTQVGNSWHYAGGITSNWWVTVVEAEPFAGREVASFATDLCCGGTAPLNFSMFSVNQGGDVLYHGWRYPVLDEHGVMDPPVVFLLSALTVGASWTSEGIEREYTAGVLTGETSWYRTGVVAALEPVVVPAGEFMAYRIEIYAPAENKKQTHVRGDFFSPRPNRSSLRSTDTLLATDWVAEGVGLIKRQYPGGSILDLELLSFTPAFVQVEKRSWAGVKALFD